MIDEGAIRIVSKISGLARSTINRGIQKPAPSDIGEKKTCAAGSTPTSAARSASASPTSFELNDKKMRIAARSPAAVSAEASDGLGKIADCPAVVCEMDHSL
jgi:hypothetical protein